MLNVSKELRDKLATRDDVPIADSNYSVNQDGTHIERVLGTKGVYVSSEADGWELRGPFDAAQ
jgi:hypothetical protein